MRKNTLLIIISIFMLIGFTSCDPIAKNIAEGLEAIDPATDPQVHEKYFDIEENGTAFLKADLSDLPVSLLIPEKVGEVAVTAIRDCSGSFETVKIPGNVKTIYEDAFLDCPNLANVTIEDGVDLIEIGAFSGCTKLTQVVINSLNIEIEYGAFPMSNSIKFWLGTHEYSSIGELMEALDG